jgi:uncharacterized protein (TIGR02677 family)
VNFAFVYIQSEKAALYRTIMQVFVDAKDRYMVQLRLQDVIQCMAIPPESSQYPEIESALAQLCEWGNLQTRPDTSNVCTVEDFYNPRHTYRLTKQGEAFERALASYELNSGRERPLQSCCLTDVRLVIQELKQLSPQAERNAAQIRRNMILLFALFDNCLAAAQTLMHQLDTRTELRPPDVRSLIEYCRRTLGELELEVTTIGNLVMDVEHAGLDRLILVTVQRNTDERKDATTTKAVSDQCLELRLQWERFRNWFISHSHLQSGSSLLRDRLRETLPALLRMSSGIPVEGTRQIDRIRDFRILAKWFAMASSDAEAHILWRAAFGLCPARHLTINEATLTDREAQDIPTNTRWMDAPPLRISASEVRGAIRTDGLTRIIDRTSEKERLAAALHEDAQRLQNAQHPFGNGTRVRLSELQHLAPGEFELFLNLLGDAVAARLSVADSVEILSGDGCLKVCLEPTGDDRNAQLKTADGIFTGPDQWIRIEQIATPDLSEATL